MSRLGLLSVVVLLIAAGCSGIGGSSGLTVTPAPVPTGTATPTPAPRLAPGIAPTGIVDPEALVAAHVSVLNGTSYTVSSSRIDQYPNGSIQSRTVSRIAIAADGRYHYTFDSMIRRGPGNGSTVHREVWWDGDRRVSVLTRDGTTVYRTERVDGVAQPPFDPTFHTGLATLFDLGTHTVTERIALDGTTLYRLHAAGFDEGDVFGYATDVSMTSLVEERGLVREYRLRFTITRSSSPVRVTRTVRFGGIGTTTLERPEWYDEAVANATDDG